MNFINQPRRLFLIDASGAALSAFLLGVVLSWFSDLVGLPAHILYTLAFFAIILCTYSFICYLKNATKSGSFLKILSILNGSYFLITLILIIVYSDSLKWPGYIYFTGELSILTVLILKEWKASARL